MNPKISIIVPVYNVESYIKRCIDSILNQTFKEFELILIDDGSLDKSGVICDMYKEVDNRIIVIHKNNQGVSIARNYGIDGAKGDYICFIDSDDWIIEDSLEYLYNLVNKNNIDIGCYRMNIYKNNLLLPSTNDDEKIQVYNGAEIIREYVDNGTFLYSVWNKIYSRHLFENIRFDVDIRYAEDALINYYLLHKSKRVVYSNIKKYNYCINSEGTTSNIDIKRLDILKAQIRIYMFLYENYPNYISNVVKEYVNSSIAIVIDICTEGTLIKKFLILKKLKYILNNNKEIIRDMEQIQSSRKICFYLLRVSPILVAILYRAYNYIKKIKIF